MVGGWFGMLPIERQKRIRELILDNQHMKISELSKELQVSEMTIHRDVKPLIEDGFIEKTFGGISLQSEADEKKVNEGKCVICCKTVNERMAYRLITSDNRIEVTCCAHCGLIRHRQLDKEVVQAICADFFRHTTISALVAWYVVDTSLQLDCCQPQALPFERKTEAYKFVKGFGGRVLPFQEVSEMIYNQMNGDCCHSFNEVENI